MADPPTTPWWLIPNVAALDAPVVAAVWQRFLAARFGVTVPWAATGVLAAVVWAVYLADRWLDARRGARGTDRHRAAARHPRLFVAGATAAAAAAGLTALTLPAGYLRAGAAVGAGVVGYLAVVHSIGVRRFPSGAKEFLVGIGFAAGVAVPLVADGPPVAHWLPATAAFGALCWLNCRLIDRWESAAPGATPEDWGLGLAIVAGVALSPAAVGLATGGAVAGLLAVHLSCRRSPRAARVLADAVLLTPLAAWASP